MRSASLLFSCVLATTTLAVVVGFSFPSSSHTRSSSSTALSMIKKSKMPSVTSPPSSTMVIIDVENVRGATSFRITHDSLFYRVRAWRADRAAKQQLEGRYAESLEALVFACDHGKVPGMFAGGEALPTNAAAVFAGPSGRTADDVIVEIIERRSSFYGDDSDIEYDEALEERPRNTTMVVTADVKLISRCQKAGRAGNSASDVIFVEPSSLLQQLESFKDGAAEQHLFGVEAGSDATPGSKPSQSGQSRPGTSDSWTSFGKSRIAEEQDAKFKARFEKKTDNAAAVTTTPSQEEEEEDIDEEEAFEEEEREREADEARIAAARRTAETRRHLLLSDSFYLARPRAGRQGNKMNPKFNNRNISKKQQKKLYAKRYKAGRERDMAEAAGLRIKLAERLRGHLEGVAAVGVTGMVVEPIGRMLEWFAERQAQEGLYIEDGGARGSGSDSNGVSAGAVSILGFGGVGSDGRLDPFSSVLNVPSRGEHEDEENNDSGQSRSAQLPPLRMVVISDTHGFEGALSGFPSPGTADDGSQYAQPYDYLLPPADVLLHCGDFAASGSRKTQRSAARRLDDFLARQTHIPEKIVVMGNHDPHNSPGKALFPTSGALYVRESSTLTVRGVKFVIEPYSRRYGEGAIYREKRRAGRLVGEGGRAAAAEGQSSASSPLSYQDPSSSSSSPILPECDVFVTHEPPRGVLDLTYHGMSAGSRHLKEVVENADVKPRVWLCGHIHEGRGAIRKSFDTSDADAADAASTLVVNAANANAGRANRIVSGAVVVDVERPISNKNGEEGAETAAGTCEILRRDPVVNTDADSSDGENTGLSDLGDLEVFVTRPGVRRRKGIPQSMRQRVR